MKRKFYLSITAPIAVQKNRLFKIAAKDALSLALFLLIGGSLMAQNNFFTAVNTSVVRMAPLTKKISKMASFSLNEMAMRKHLLNAPLQFHNNGITMPLDVPLPDGQIETFNLVESPMVSPTVAALHPEIKTYTGNGTRNKRAVITVSLTSSGFNAIILNIEGTEAVYIEKFAEIYGSYYSKDITVPTDRNLINVPEGIPALPKQGLRPRPKNQKSTHVAASLSSGTQIRTFRLSMAATAEFTANHGGTVAGGYDALMGYVARMNAFYINELSIKFVLVSDDSFVFTTANPGTFTNGDDDALFIQNKALVDANIGLENYDVAFVMGSNGEGFSAGGVAYFESICDDDLKAGSVANEGDINIYAQYYFDKTLFHEMGHKIGMSHSYNSTIPVCTSREAETSVEPGSGASVMSYGFKCGSDDYFESDNDGLILNFHSVSYNQAVTFLATVVSPDPVFEDTHNTPPVITMPSNYTIPKSTPFMLTGSATDADGDELTYSWEGTNIGTSEPTTTTFSNTGEAPFFRSFAPVTSGSRMYPQIDRILDGSNYGCNRGLGDKLPSKAYVTTHTLTVRDNRAGGGGVTNGAVTVTVAGSGPFLITNDAPGNILGPSTSFVNLGLLTVNWSVNGTTAAPVNCQLVDIFLSTDGGLTFPTTLATSILNALGTAIVTLPTINTYKARIKIAPSTSTALGNVPNIFFDISDNNFTIGSPMPVTLVSFDAKLKGKNTAQLSWETATETDNAGFDIEMSPDAKRFVKVGFVDGNGTATVSHQYQYDVTDLAAGTYYFRLKQMDLDGKSSYSQIRALDVISADDLLSIYPNPTNGKLKFNSGMHKSEAFGIKILNQNGQEVMSLPANAKYTQGSELDVTALPTGLYNVTIQGKSFTEHLKFVKM